MKVDYTTGLNGSKSLTFVTQPERVREEENGTERDEATGTIGILSSVRHGSHTRPLFPTSTHTRVEGNNINLRAHLDRGGSHPIGEGYPLLGLFSGQ